jgi:FkbM family methyltransferase
MSAKLDEVSAAKEAARDARDRARVEEIRQAIAALRRKPRLQLIESLNTSLVTEGPHGVRYSHGSLTEYRRIMTQKPWDEPIADWVSTFSPSDVFFDIGANIGAFSLLAGRLHGGHMRVFSFEPGFETFAALTRNILLNNLEQSVTPLQVALFDETGLIPFHYRKLSAGSASHAVGEPIDSKHRRFKPVAVQRLLTFRLDDLIERFALPRPTRIKVDVDGVESRVLAGAAHTLAGGPCELWVELTEAAPGDPAPAQTVRMLTDLGFELVRRVEHEAPPNGYPCVHDALFVCG